MSLDNVLLPQPQQHIIELEEHLNTAVDFMKDRGLLLQLPEQLRRYVFSRDNSAEVFYSQLLIAVPKACRQDRSYWGSAFNADDHARTMVQFLPKVKELSTLVDSEEYVFKALEKLWLNTVGDDPDTKGTRTYGESVKYYEELDDAFVVAILKLWKKQGIKHLDDVIRHHEKERKIREDLGLKGYCERSLQLLQEIQMIPMLKQMTATALQSSPLPPEMIKLVQEAFVEVHFPVEGMEEVWTMPRPDSGRCIFTPMVTTWDSRKHVWITRENEMGPYWTHYADSGG